MSRVHGVRGDRHVLTWGAVNRERRLQVGLY